jgi:hypothetical protein
MADEQLDLRKGTLDLLVLQSSPRWDHCMAMA